MPKTFFMNFRVKTTSVFEKQAKKLLKKYPSLKSELVLLVKQLQQNPSQGTAIGRHCYKIRIAVASKGQGKSGGARIITCLVYRNTVFIS